MRLGSGNSLFLLRIQILRYSSCSRNFASPFGDIFTDSVGTADDFDIMFHDDLRTNWERQH